MLDRKYIIATIMVSFLLLTPTALTEDNPRGSGSELTMQLMRTEPLPMVTGEYADVWVKVVNEGHSDAEDVSVEFVDKFPFSMDPDRDRVKRFRKIEGRDAYTAHFQVRVDEMAVPGENDLKLRLRYDGGSLTREFPVQVRTRETVLSVEDVEVEEGRIPPSQTRDMTLTLKNRAHTHLRSVGVSLGLKPEGSGEPEMGMEAEFFGMEDFETMEEIPLITVGQTTEERISQIAPGEEKDVTFSVRAEHDADEETYKVPIALRFEGERYRMNRETGEWEMSTETFQNQEFTGVRVGGEPVLQVGLAGVDDYPVKGTKRDVSLEIINKGFSEAKFLDIELLPDESYEVIGEPDMYIGHMGSDDYDSPSFEMYLSPDHERVEIPVELEYKDNEENIIVENQTIRFRAYTWDELEELGVEDEDGIILYIILIAIILGVLYYYRRCKKKKTESLLEEE